MQQFNDDIINNRWRKEWFRFIKENPDKPWFFGWLSLNPNITWDIVKDNPDKLWNFKLLSINPNITWNIVKANPDVPWDFYYLSQHPNITWDIVKDNPDIPWDFKKMSANKMSAAKAKYIEHLTQSVDIISDWFLDLKTDPDSKLCQKWMTRVQSEYYKTDPWKQ